MGDYVNLCEHSRDTAHVPTRIHETSRVWKKLLVIFATNVASCLHKASRRKNIITWMFAIVRGSKSVFAIPYMRECNVNGGVLHVVHNTVMGLIRERETIDEECTMLYRVSSILTLAIMALENSTTFRKHASLLKNFSMSLLLDIEQMFSVYVVLSTETKKSYVGLVGMQGPRYCSLRTNEHIRGMRKGGLGRTPSLKREAKDACEKFYKVAHTIGAHKFAMIPCFFEVNSIGELNKLETKWIRKLMPELNTQKLPFKNRKQRARPFPNKRRGANPIPTLEMNECDRNVIPKIYVNVHQDNSADLKPMERTVVTAKTKNALKRDGGTKVVKFHTDLLTVFNELSQRRGALRHAVFRQKGGNFGLTRITGLIRKFGRTTIEVLHDPQSVLGEKFFTLKQFVQRICNHNCTKYTVRIKTFVISTPRNSPYYRTLVNAATHQDSEARRAIVNEKGGYDAKTLIKMWTMIRWIPTKGIRERAQDLVMQALKTRGMNPRPNTVLVLPHRDDIVLNGVRLIPDTIIKAMDVDPLYKNILHSETRIAMYRRKNMRDMLLNNRKIVKGSDPAHEQCTCKELMKALGMTEQQAEKHMIDGHLGIKATDIPDNKEIDTLLKSNLKNIPKTDVNCLRDEIITGAEEWMRKVMPAIQCDKSRPSPIVFKGKYVYVYEYAHAKLKDKHMAQISLERFQRWHFEYNLIRQEKPELYRKYRGTNFVNDVVRMVKIHTRNVDGTKSKHHWVNHLPLYEKMSRIFGIKTEYFASPLNFNLAHESYFSEFTIDRLFGSNGNSWKHRWHVSGAANPIFEAEAIVRTFAFAKKFAGKSTSNAYVITIPMWERMGAEYLHFLKDPHVHPLVTFDDRGYAFHHPDSATNQWKYTQTPHIMAPWAVGLFLVRQEPITDEEKVKLNELRTYLESMGFSPHDEESMKEFMWDKTILSSELVDFPIPVDKVEKRSLRKWKPNCPNLHKVYVKVPGAARLHVTCDRYKIDFDKLVDTCLRKCAKSSCRRTKRDTMLMTPERLMRLNKKIAQLRKIATISEVDKNSSCAFFACHCCHMRGINDTFLDDPHYKKEQKSPKEIIHEYNTTFIRNKWERFGGFKKTDNLPYGYILPKNKNVKENRPIVSYCAHPMAKVLQRTGRALKHMLDICYEKHLTMNKTNDFVTRLEKVFTSFTDEGYDHVVMMAGDIKKMYTELSHDCIMNAVDWIIDLTRKRRRGSEISVPKFGRHGTKIGRSFNDCFVKFKLKDIRDIVKFDLDNAIFNVRGTTLRQIVGIPMGSPISPILAVLMCAYNEANYMTDQRKKGEHRRVDGVRYVDDALFASGYNSNVLGDKDKAQKAIDHMIKNAYHEKLKIEVDTNQEQIQMLESIIDTTEIGKLSISFWYKNEEMVKKEKKQKVLKFQHFDSFSPYTSKKGVIISTLMRMRTATNNSKTLQHNLSTLAEELSLLSYPYGILKSALDSVRRKAKENNDDMWTEVHMPDKEIMGGRVTGH